MAIRKLVLAVLLAAGGAAAVSAPARPWAEDSHEKGRAIVVGAYELGPDGACFHCHGVDGAGIAEAGFPRLSAQFHDVLLKALRDYADGRRPNPIMQPIAQALGTEEMRQVSAYYAAQKGIPHETVPEADRELLQLGERLSAEGDPDQGISACSNCHGPAGAGTPPIFPYLAGQHAIYVEEQLLLWKRGLRDGDPGGIMEHIASRMSYRQIRAAAVYFASLQPPGSAPADAPATSLSDITAGQSDARPAE
ncbi:MAG TPA: cytochrome C [Arenibaculum sp.]|nr:cytochrome C [Arenibaculum sp.]